MTQEIRTVREMATGSRDRLAKLADRLASLAERVDESLAEIDKGTRRDTLVGHTSETMTGRRFPKPHSPH